MSARERWLILPLALILAVAGVVHLVSPEVFHPAMPPYLPWPHEIILFTGVCELLAAAGLFPRKSRRVTALTLAVYFVAILPAHWHIATNGIAMFGAAHPGVLWGRLLFQPVLVLWALSIAKASAANR